MPNGADSNKEDLTELSSKNNKCDSISSINYDIPTVQILDPETEAESYVHRPDGGWGWMVVIGCYISMFILGGLSRSYGVLYAYLLKQFDSSAAVISWIGGCQTSLRMVLSPLATYFSVRFSHKNVVCIGGLIYGSGLIVCAFAYNIYILFLGYGVLSGIGGALIYSPGIVLVGEYFVKKRAKASGISSSASGLGVFLFPVLVNHIVKFYSLFGCYLLMGAISFHTIISGLLYRPLQMKNSSKPKTSESNSITKSEGSSVNLKTNCLPSVRKCLNLGLWQHPPFIFCAIALCLMTSSYMPNYFFISSLMVSHGNSDTIGAVILSVMGISDMIGRISSGFVFDFKTVRKRRIYMYNASVFALSLTSLSFAFSSSNYILFTTAVFSGLFTGCIVGQRSVVMADIVGIEKLSSAFGWTVFSQGVGLLAGPPLAGFLVDMSGTFTLTYVFLSILSSLAGFTFLAGIIFHKKYNLNKRES